MKTNFFSVSLLLVPLSHSKSRSVNLKGRSYKFMSYNKLLGADYQGSLMLKVMLPEEVVFLRLFTISVSQKMNDVGKNEC